MGQYIDSRDNNDYYQASAAVERSIERYEKDRKQQANVMNKLAQAIELRRAKGDKRRINWNVDKYGIVTENDDKSLKYSKWLQPEEKKLKFDEKSDLQIDKPTNNLDKIKEERDRIKQAYYLGYDAMTNTADYKNQPGTAIEELRNKEGKDIEKAVQDNTDIKNSKELEVIKEEQKEFDKKRNEIKKDNRTEIDPDIKKRALELTQPPNQQGQGQGQGQNQPQGTPPQGTGQGQGTTQTTTDPASTQQAAQGLAAKLSATEKRGEELAQRFGIGKGSNLGYDVSMKTSLDVDGSEVEDVVVTHSKAGGKFDANIFNPIDLMAMSMVADAQGLIAGDQNSGDTYRKLAEKMFDVEKEYRDALQKATAYDTKVEKVKSKIGGVKVSDEYKEGITAAASTNIRLDNSSKYANSTSVSAGYGSGGGGGGEKLEARNLRVGLGQTTETQYDPTKQMWHLGGRTTFTKLNEGESDGQAYKVHQNFLNFRKYLMTNKNKQLTYDDIFKQTGAHTFGTMIRDYMYGTGGVPLYAFSTNNILEPAILQNQDVYNKMQEVLKVSRGNNLDAITTATIEGLKVSQDGRNALNNIVNAMKLSQQEKDLFFNGAGNDPNKQKQANAVYNKVKAYFAQHLKGASTNDGGYIQLSSNNDENSLLEAQGRIPDGVLTLIGYSMSNRANAK